MSEANFFVKSERSQICNSRILIKEVKIRRPLWDRKEDGYNHRATQIRLWREVSLKLGPSSAVVRKKWKGLRDVYRKELKRQRALSKTDSNEQTFNPRWKFFQPMMFLREQLQMSDLPPLVLEIQPKLEIEPTDDNSNISNDISDFSDSIDLSVRLTASEENIHLPNSQCAVSTEPVRTFAQFQKDFNEFEMEKAPPVSCNFSECSEDSDALFFLSLLPFMKSLDISKKMVLRAKIQQYVCDFLYGNSANCNACGETNS